MEGFEFCCTGQKQLPAATALTEPFGKATGRPPFGPRLTFSITGKTTKIVPECLERSLLQREIK